MKIAKKFTAAAHRHEFFVVRRRLRFQLFCEQCTAEKEFIPLDDAVLFSGLSTRKILRLVEADNLHFLESSGGHLFICHHSLNSFEPIKRSLEK